MKSLDALDQYASPFVLMSQVHQALDELMLSLGDHHQHASAVANERHFTADDLLPITAYVLSNTSLRFLPSTIAYVRSFGLHQLELSALGYSFTTVEAAAQFLASV